MFDSTDDLDDDALDALDAELDADAGDALDAAIRALRAEAEARFRGRRAEWTAAKYILNRLGELARVCRQTRAGGRR